MQRVQTWVRSPYLGVFQYKNAGPERIHKKVTMPFFLPASPYLGTLRHDLIKPVKKPLAPKFVSIGVQTETNLGAYVIHDYAS